MNKHSCEFLEVCKYYSSHCEEEGEARQSILCYCLSPSNSSCQRKKFQVTYGIPPSDSLSPSGELL